MHVRPWPPPCWRRSRRVPPRKRATQRLPRRRPRRRWMTHWSCSKDPRTLSPRARSRSFSPSSHSPCRRSTPATGASPARSWPAPTTGRPTATATDTRFPRQPTRRLATPTSACTGSRPRSTRRHWWTPTGSMTVMGLPTTSRRWRLPPQAVGCRRERHPRLDRSCFRRCPRRPHRQGRCVSLGNEAKHLWLRLSR